MRTIKNFSILSALLYLSGCGVLTAESEPNKNNPNTAASREQTVNVNANSNTGQTSQDGFELPTPRPIEKGKPQSVGGITVTVPADWKKIDQRENWVKFVSPEKIELYLNRSYDLQKLDLLADFYRLRKENPTYKAMTRAIDGELGILYLNSNDPILKGDVLNWTTFPPPDERSYAVKRSVMLVCPSGTYEQNKQIMFDILFSTKLGR